MTRINTGSVRIPFMILAIAALLAASLIPMRVEGSSHREAPLISRDPTADNTDLYAFRSPDGSNSVTIIANYIPLEEPAGGPNFSAFDDNVLYEIKVDNTGDALADVTYQVRFKTTYSDSDLFGPSYLLNDFPVTSATDPDLLVKQTYTVTRVVGGVATVLGTGNVPPTNIGPRSTPSYGTTGATGKINLSNGGKAFAGPRDDPFFVDLGSIFDLGGLRPFNPAHLIPLTDEPGVDGVAGYNTHSIALKLPITELTATTSVPALGSPDAVIGVWATASRQKVTVLKKDGTMALNDGWVQVSRLGNPLINEVIIPLRLKDYWNFQAPNADAQFAKYYTKPALAAIADAVYPPLGPIRHDGRADLVAILLTGLPVPANSPLGNPTSFPFTFTGTTKADMLRLNVAVAPCVEAGPNRFDTKSEDPAGACSRLGVLDGDLAGFPNGRRLEDDVTDIELRAVLDGYGTFVNSIYGSLTPNQPINNDVGDGVNANDKAFMASFPFVASPFGGYDMGVNSFHHVFGSKMTGTLMP